MKSKIILVLFMFMFLMFGMGITYSYFNSSSVMSNIDQKIAGFIFNAQELDHLELPLVDLVPGQSEEYNFSVTNSSDGRISDVTIEYQLIVKTPHLAPLIIELYDETGTLILSCDESYSRNDDNELVCNAPMQEMVHSKEAVDDYKLKVTFDSNYNSLEFSNLVDYINIEIKSFQKV